MLLWFLRLFRQFRESESRESEIANLREAVSMITTEKLLLQDRLDSALADKDRLWEVMQAALENERHALRTQVNHAVQRSGGGVVYGDAHILPQAAVPRRSEPGAVGRGSRRLASEVANQVTSEFLRDMYSRSQVEEING